MSSLVATIGTHFSLSSQTKDFAMWRGSHFEFPKKSFGCCFFVHTLSRRELRVSWSSEWAVTPLSVVYMSYIRRIHNQCKILVNFNQQQLASYCIILLYIIVFVRLQYIDVFCIFKLNIWGTSYMRRYMHIYLFLILRRNIRFCLRFGGHFYQKISCSFYASYYLIIIWYYISCSNTILLFIQTNYIYLLYKLL